MGLDMFIFKTEKENTPDMVQKIIKNLEIENSKYVDLGLARIKITSVVDDDFDSAMYHELDSLNPSVYWRNANAINNWLANKLNDGGKFYYPVLITKETLTDLYNCCKTVLSACTDEKGNIKINQKICKKILPCNQYYKHYGYDEEYIQYIKETVSHINRIFLTTNFDKSNLLYIADW